MNNSEIDFDKLSEKDIDYISGSFIEIFEKIKEQYIVNNDFFEKKWMRDQRKRI